MKTPFRNLICCQYRDKNKSGADFNILRNFARFSKATSGFEDRNLGINYDAAGAAAAADKWTFAFIQHTRTSRAVFIIPRPILRKNNPIIMEWWVGLGCVCVCVCVYSPVLLPGGRFHRQLIKHVY